MVLEVAKLIPSSVLKKVLLITTLAAFEMVLVKENSDSAGRAMKLMLVTAVKSLNPRVDRVVRFCRLNVPPIEPMEVLPKLTRLPAFKQSKSPVICRGPSMLIEP